MVGTFDFQLFCDLWDVRRFGSSQLFGWLKSGAGSGAEGTGLTADEVIVVFIPASSEKADSDGDVAAAMPSGSAGAGHGSTVS